MTELHIRFDQYRITRNADHPDAAGNQPARYTVYRPDGTPCCTGAEWSDVERVINADRAARSDKLVAPEATTPPPPGQSHP